MSKSKVMRMIVLCLAALLSPALAHATMESVTIISPTGGEQHASNGNWDSGTFTLTVNGHSESVPFGQFSSVNAIASGLAAKFSQDCTSPVQAHARGAVITFTSTVASVNATLAWDSADFSQASFNILAESLPTPSLALTCTPNPVPAGGSADCAAELPKGATGTISFTLTGQSSWSTVQVDTDGFAPASTLSSLSSGQYTVTASYSGSSSYSGTSESLALQVDSTTTLPSTSVYNYTITPTGGTSGYAANGNILSYTDSVNGKWSMTSSGYDGLNRLVGATYTPVGSSTSQYWCWSYDSFGNRLSEAFSPNSLSSSSCPTGSTGTVQASSHLFDDSGSSPNNHTNRIIDDVDIQYDAAGNTTSDHDNSYLYDGDGHVCAVNNGLVMTQYIYDADGTRVAKGTITSWSCDTTSNGFQATTSYVLGSGGEQVTEMNVNSGQQTWAHTNVYAGGMLVATYDPLGLHFHLDDWLGNRRVQTNAFGQVEETCANLPFGNGLNCTSPEWAPVTADDATEHHFTGKERDTESGLDYFKYRMYPSSMGRWISPDPSGLTHADLGNPQSLNLYNYVGNSPLTRTDLDGLCWKGFQWACNAGQIARNVHAGYGWHTDKGVEERKNRADAFLSEHNIPTTGLSLAAVFKLYGKTYQTYRKINLNNGKEYNGRTSGTNSPEENVRVRDLKHRELDEEGYGEAKLVRSSSDPDAIRGHEDNQIRDGGGAQSAEGTSGNKIRGIAESNPKREAYLKAAAAEDEAAAMEVEIEVVEVFDEIPE